MLKLYYFNLHGLGEQIRMLLNHSQTPFEDIRPGGPTGPSWPAFKSSTPNGQMPVLDVPSEDGSSVVRLHQASSIMRYLGKLKGYYPTENNAAAAMKAFYIDAALDDMADFRSKMPSRLLFGGTPMNNQDLSLMLNGYEKMFDRLEEYLNKSSGKFLVSGDTPTIIDFHCFATMYSGPLNSNGNSQQRHVYKASKELMEKYEKLMEWVNVMNGELEEYMKARPTGFPY